MADGYPFDPDYAVLPLAVIQALVAIVQEHSAEQAFAKQNPTDDPSTIVAIDGSHVRASEALKAFRQATGQPGCPHCPDGHASPQSRPWGVYVAAERDGDGQPTHLRVGPSDGAHVAQSDADWLWQLIRTEDGRDG